MQQEQTGLPHSLELRVGAVVTVCAGETALRGSRGVVTALSDDGVCVRFDEDQELGASQLHVFLGQYSNQDNARQPPVPQVPPLSRLPSRNGEYDHQTVGC